jgi:hypothetical protein
MSISKVTAGEKLPHDIAAGRALSGEGGTGRCRLSHAWCC